MTIELNPELEDEIAEHLKKYEFTKTKEAIRRAEELKSGVWRPDWQTAEECLKIANQWLKWFDQPKEFFYKVRDVGNTYQIYQDADSPKKEDEDGLEPAA